VQTRKLQINGTNEGQISKQMSQVKSPNATNDETKTNRTNSAKCVYAKFIEFTPK